MLHNTRAIHPVNIRQRNRLLARLVDPYMNESDMIVEVGPQDCGGDEGDDVGEFRGVGDPALGVEWVVYG